MNILSLKNSIHFFYKKVFLMLDTTQCFMGIILLAAFPERLLFYFSHRRCFTVADKPDFLLTCHGLYDEV